MGQRSRMAPERPWGLLAQNDMVVTKIIWMDGWEFECCGEPFEVGSPVRWMLGVVDRAGKERVAALLGEAEASRLTHYETHHGPHDDEVLTYATGTVAAITAVYQSYDDRGRLVEGSAYAKDCGSAERVVSRRRPHPEQLRVADQSVTHAPSAAYTSSYARTASFTCCASRSAEPSSFAAMPSMKFHCRTERLAAPTASSVYG
jgi:hypothetical protein